MKNKNIEKPQSTFQSYSLICRVLMSFSAYLLTACIIFFTLFLVGNFQSFTDKSQTLLLLLISIISIILIFSSISGLIANIIFLCVGVRISHRITSIIVLLFLTILGIIFLLFSVILAQLSKGI